MAKVKLGTKYFSADSEEIDASYSQVTVADRVAFCARLSAGDFKRLRVLNLVSVFLLFLLVFVLRVFCCCEESGRLTCAVQGFNGIGAEGCKALGEALKVNTSVQILILVSVFVLFLLVFVLRVFCCCEESGRLTCAVQGRNGIGDEGGKALGEALKVGAEVTTLLARVPGKLVESTGLDCGKTRSFYKLHNTIPLPVTDPLVALAISGRRER